MNIELINQPFKKALLGWALVSSSLMVAGSAYAEVAEKDKKAIQAKLQQIIPNAPQSEIAETPVKGLYEVKIGMDVVYMSANGQYLFQGALVNLQTKENLTEKRKSEIRKTAMAKISVDSMIVYPAEIGEAGQKERYMTVFTDIDCPYCHKLHKEIPALNKAGITVRYLSYPRAGVGSPSYQKAVSVWCAKDPAKTMNMAMTKKTLETKQCDNPVKDHMMQAQVFGVNGTPNIVLDNGELLPGYVPAKELIKMMKNPA